MRALLKETSARWQQEARTEPATVASGGPGGSSATTNSLNLKLELQTAIKAAAVECLNEEEMRKVK